MVEIKGATSADKQAVAAARAANKADTAKPKAAAKPANTRRQQTKRGDQAPEAKKSAKAQSDAAEKLFKDADQAARSGLPHDINKEQHENYVRRAALGY